jgi:hypothetical protein
LLENKKISSENIRKILIEMKDNRIIYSDIVIDQNNLNYSNASKANVVVVVVRSLALVRKVKIVSISSL